MNPNGHRIVAVSIILFGSTCMRLASPSLDEVLEEFATQNHRSYAASCQCFELIGDSDYMSEQECRDVAGSVDDEDLACIEDVLAKITQDQDEAVALMECYNTAVREGADCLETNIGVCSSDTFGVCVESRRQAIDSCDAGYPEDDLETLWYCRF